MAQIYDSRVLDFISNFSPDIQNLSTELGISASGIAGAIAEENNAWYGKKGFLDAKTYQEIPEALFVRSDVLSPVAANYGGPFAYGIAFSTKTHEDLADEYTLWSDDGANGPSGPEIFGHEFPFDKTFGPWAAMQNSCRIPGTVY